MIDFLAQAPPVPNFWARNPGSAHIITLIVVFLIGVGIMFALMQAPTRLRKWIVGGFTFLAGSFFVLKYLWPEPINRGPNDIPDGFVEGVGFWITDATPSVAGIANILTAFLLGLGIFSLVRLHFKRFIKKQKDWGFSALLLGGLIVMVIIGYADWYTRQFKDTNNSLADPNNWGFVNKAGDILFDGLIQQMDAAMFSMIAFFILSAAYRAFRIRSVEATVMMASALILMFSLMGAVNILWSGAVEGMTGGDPSSFWNNLRLTEIANWVKNYLQVPSLRALDFGVGLGALAMGLRIWLGLEKGGVTT